MRPEGPICLINRPATEWLACFVPAIEKQWWHPFLRSRLKHCFLIRKDTTSGAWLLFEPWWSRILIATLTDEEAGRFLKWGKRGVILVVPEYIPGMSSQLRGWMSCAALVAHVLGRSYNVYTPHGLLRHLLREPGVRFFNARADGHNAC